MKPSRRHFLQTVAALPIAAGVDLTGQPCVKMLAALLPPEQVDFGNPHFIRYDSHCFTINDRDTFIFSAAFHYPRCPRPLWRDRLLKFKHAGFNTIESYVFWNYHEPEEGQADLAEFEEFVSLIQELGFFMIVRPGPYVCAEWERGGFPSWVAAKRFPLRSNEPESIKTSQHWYDEVLPIIRKHKVTVGGPIIMVQVENEYDFSPPMPDAEKRDYLGALARMVWNAGIDLPIITCWTKQARENSYPDMARIMDTCNFYPRWNILRELPPALIKLRLQEPMCPLGITELQGGWFSQFGGKLSVNQDGVNAAQLNMLTKTAIEQGVAYFSYYMGFGGTNFDWAGKTITTSYDYAAPIREPGGLWDKYYAARGICHSLRLFGSLLTRAESYEGAASTNPGVSVTERVNGKSAVVFVRENTNTQQSFKISITDPNSPTKRKIEAPREGELEIEPRGMKMLPVQIPISGTKLTYSTAELLATGRNLDRDFLILYDEPGRVVEIGLATEEEPKVHGDTLYQYWDPEYESAVIGVRVEKEEKMFLFNQSLQVILLPRDRALRTFVAELPPAVVPGAEDREPMAVPVMTDAYFLAGAGSEKHRAWADIEFLPGKHDVVMLLPPLPTKCWIDGVQADFQYDRSWRTTRLELSTPGVPYSPIDLMAGHAWVEKFDPSLGEWENGSTRPLEDMRPVPYGYVKYRAQFNAGAEPKMFISTYTDDLKQVFVNGTNVPEASDSRRQSEFDLTKYARSGSNTLEIAYEAFGAANGGKELGDLKGIESVRVGKDARTGVGVDDWQIQRFPAPMRERELDTHFSAAWNSASFSSSGGSQKALIPAFTWCRTGFELPRLIPEWVVPWKLLFEADCDALIYLNEKFIGRYTTRGPQTEFFLPEPYFSDGKKNLLTFVLAYTDQASHLHALRVTPYGEFAARRTRVEFEW